MTKPRAPGSAHEAADELINQAGGVKVVADFEGVGTSTIYKMLDPEQTQTELSFVRVSRLTAHFKVSAAAEHLALLAGGRFVADRDIDAAPCDMTALCDLAAKSADAMGEFAKARGDGEWTRDEIRTVRTELGELLVAVLAADARLARIENGEGA